MDLPLYRPSPPPTRSRRGLPVVTLTVASVIAILCVIDGAGSRPGHLRGASPLPEPLTGTLAVLGLVAAGWIECSLRAALRRRIASRRFRRDCDEFDGDLRDALERERRELLDRTRAAPGVTIGRGTVLSGVRVHGEPTTSIHRDMPLVVRSPGRIRVVGPSGAASVVADALLDRTRSGGGGIEVEVGGASPRQNLATDTTEIWLGPDGMAFARSTRQAGGAWVEVEPCAG